MFKQCGIPKNQCGEISKLAKRYFKYKYKNERRLKDFKAKYEVK